MALGAFATPTAELVRTGVELISRNREMAQLRQALTSRISIEQAKACWRPAKRSRPTRGSSSSGRGPGRRRVGWPIWFGRCWCRRHNVSGSWP